MKYVSYEDIQLAKWVRPSTKLLRTMKGIEQQQTVLKKGVAIVSESFLNSSHNRGSFELLL
jgi:hypothetical protein